jgi:hypothetical protein
VPLSSRNVQPESRTAASNGRRRCMGEEIRAESGDSTAD